MKNNLLRVFFSTILKIAPLQIKNSPCGLRHFDLRALRSLRMVSRKKYIRGLFFIYSQYEGG